MVSAIEHYELPFEQVRHTSVSRIVASHCLGNRIGVVPARTLRISPGRVMEHLGGSFPFQTKQEGDRAAVLKQTANGGSP